MNKYLEKIAARIDFKNAGYAFDHTRVIAKHRKYGLSRLLEAKKILSNPFFRENEAPWKFQQDVQNLRYLGFHGPRDEHLINTARPDKIYKYYKDEVYKGYRSGVRKALTVKTIPKADREKAQRKLLKHLAKQEL